MDKLSRSFLHDDGGYVQRANPQQLQEIFNKYASKEKNGEKLMTPEDFAIKFLGLFDPDDYNVNSVQLLAGIVDIDKDGYISFMEFQEFEGILCFPDAVYKSAFQLFDTDGNRLITYQEFVQVMSKTELHQRIPFNMSSLFMELYFGKDKQRTIPYCEFSQFLHDFHEEYALEAFRRADKEGSGFISYLDFYFIMMSIKSHLLTKQVLYSLTQVAQRLQCSGKVSFGYFMAFNSLLNDMELAKRIYLDVTNGHKMKEISKGEFMHSAQAISQMTPLEVDILFEICDVLYQRKRINFDNLTPLAPEYYYKQITSRLRGVKGESRGAMMQILESLYRFTLGSVAGAVGASVVFPIDLVKTRMQNQRTDPSTGLSMYKNSIDCFMKVIKREGVRGLYRGLLPVVVGVAPEKAIQLSVKDFVREKFYDQDGNIPFYGEILAGAAAGTCQVFVTNPLEIVKIRLQVAGEAAAKVRAGKVVKELGFFGLYRGAKACWLRDVPFASIYFSLYASIKGKFADENGYNHPATLLAAGFLAGIPAAGIVTPADVIKTRLQVVPRTGQVSYNGIVDAARKIFAREGFRAFWKGMVPRMCRSPPQFAMTMLTYEILQRLFNVDFGGAPTSGSGSQAKTLGGGAIKGQNPDHVGGYSVSLPVFLGIETKFGLCLPKYSAFKS